MPFPSLTADQLEFFNDNGYLILEDFTDSDAIKAMEDRANEIISAYDPAKDVVLGSQTNTTHQYFLDSASSIGVFFEKDAFDANNALIKPKAEAVHKLGHAIHDIDPVFRAWARSNNVKELLRSLGYRKPMPVQSLLHRKPAGVGSEVPMHQDGAYLASEPQSVIGLWLAMENATLENGCMWVLPGGHKPGIHRKFEHIDGKMQYTGDLPDYDRSIFEPVCVKKGTLVVLHNAIPHFSNPNRSSKSRHAWVVHYVEGADGYRWLETNWLQRKKCLPFTELYDDEEKGC